MWRGRHSSRTGTARDATRSERLDFYGFSSPSRGYLARWLMVVKAPSPSGARAQETPICVEVQYAHTRPMPTHIPGGRPRSASRTDVGVPTPPSASLRDRLVHPRYSAAEVDNTRGRRRGPPWSTRSLTDAGSARVTATSPLCRFAPRTPPLVAQTRRERSCVPNKGRSTSPGVARAMSSVPRRQSRWTRRPGRTRRRAPPTSRAVDECHGPQRCPADRAPPLKAPKSASTSSR